MSEDKTLLRRELRAARERFVEEVGTRGDLLVAHLMVAEEVMLRIEGATCVSAYFADGYEVDPLPILFQCIDRGLSVVLPRVAGRSEPMRFHRWFPGDPLVRGPLGIMQPRADAPEMEPDLILAPLVGFDRTLNRLGQGGGYFDRAFADRPWTRRIGLAWSVQEADALPIDPWDVPLHGVATEKGWFGA